MLNILFSSTKQWNVGDEFILFGIRHLLKELDVDFNSVLYNRHPSISPSHALVQWQPRLKHLLNPKKRINQDNSFFLDETGLIDYVIFAGTPEWHMGPRAVPLIKYVLENKLPCAFLGVGAPGAFVPHERTARVLKEQAELVIARDTDCYNSVAAFSNTYHENCPALFSASTEGLRPGLNKLGIVIQDCRMLNHGLSKEIFDYCMKEYAELVKAYDVEFIAHYIDDFKLARRLFPDVPCHYSSFAEDFEDFFKRFDLIVSTRVHGNGMASSLGIPNILIRHDGRGETGRLFGSVLTGGHESLKPLIDGIDVRETSRKLLAYKAEKKERWLELLRRHVSFLKNAPVKVVR
jgi:hypothetical protein